MKIFNKVSVFVLAIFLVFGFTGQNTAQAAITSPSLGTADSFSILAGTPNITNVPTSSIAGDVGLSPATGAGIGLTVAQVMGKIYSVDAFGPAGSVVNPGLLTTAKNDFNTAYDNLDAVPNAGCGTTYVGTKDLSGETLVPGTYCAGAFALSATLGPLTLDDTGAPGGVWIFKSAAALNTTSGVGASVVFLHNLASSCNVWWKVASSATIGVGTTFIGNILASTSIALQTGATLNGRAMAYTGAVTLDSNNITDCAVPAATATLTLVKHIDGGARPVADFPLDAAGPTHIAGVSGTPAVTAQVVGVGTYTLSETTQADYTQGTWSCTGIVVNGGNQITLGAGNTTTCTITNTFIPATLTLTKTVVNIGGGTKIANDFQAKIDGVNVFWNTPVTLLAGVHTASELNLPNYVASAWGGGCAVNGTITLVPGVNTCTITNTYQRPPGGSSSSTTISPVPPLIDVVKIPSPLALPAGPGLVKYTYTLRNIGTVPVSSVTMVDDSCSPLTLISGDTNADARLDTNETWIYNCSTTITKTHTNIVTATGWANGISATDIATVTVVVGAPIVPPLIHVTKVPSPLALVGGGAVTYTYTVTNPGTVPLSNVNIIDDKCTGLPGRVVGHPGDLNKNNLLESNETWTFTCKSRLTKTTTNTATASGTANGLTAKDFAIATVVVSTPGLPKTGFPPKENNASWIMIISAGVLGILISFYLARKKQKN